MDTGKERGVSGARPRRAWAVPLGVGTAIVLFAVGLAVRAKVVEWRRAEAIQRLERLGCELATETRKRPWPFSFLLGPSEFVEWVRLPTHAGDAALVHLKPLSDEVEKLDLAGTQVTDAGLVHLKDLTALGALSLSGTQAADSSLVHVKGLTTLRVLSLSGTRVTDAGLIRLKGLTGLEELYLYGTQVTDASLVHLKGLMTLHVLGIADTGVTPTGAAELRKALPGCRILGPLTGPVLGRP
jgi:hypothetical protein